jgi:hypothetical protein
MLRGTSFVRQSLNACGNPGAIHCLPSPSLSPHHTMELPKTLGGERDLKAHSLYPAIDCRMVIEFFRGEGWGEGQCRAFLRGVNFSEK